MKGRGCLTLILIVLALSGLSWLAEHLAVGLPILALAALAGVLVVVGRRRRRKHARAAAVAQVEAARKESEKARDRVFNGIRCSYCGRRHPLGTVRCDNCAAPMQATG